MIFGSAILKWLPLGIATVLVPVAAIAAPAAPNGEQVFRQRCQSCHSSTTSNPGSLAPGLAGVVGRRAASTGFANYSPALRTSGITWTSASLDRFLAAPAAMVPGTRMVVALSDRAQRAALIAYLAASR